MSRRGPLPAGRVGPWSRAPEPPAGARTGEDNLENVPTLTDLTQPFLSVMGISIDRGVVDRMSKGELTTGELRPPAGGSPTPRYQQSKTTNIKIRRMFS